MKSFSKNFARITRKSREYRLEFYNNYLLYMYLLIESIMEYINYKNYFVFVIVINNVNFYVKIRISLLYCYHFVIIFF